MKKLLLPMALMALVALPVGAHAEQCRNAKGQFAKCGTPGAMPAKAGPAMKPAAPAMKPAMAPAMKPAAPAMKPAMAPAMKPAAPAMAPAKKAPCKDAKGKFIKCPA
ncbi:hypothetical protein [Novosphingobium sp. KACC 22771]|uniref:hypothetical protein n=1 Tax=Novosphingobium sp. KACC 22771 TaxID=3025670 RepID=UPI0023652DF1|nr:hypothetical protein [Novosphingobium sp. KACC 22771]WDF71056.1 hypothetical protein PQ467_09400 [Novosphingobium sp. KACC 22771]